MSPTKAKGAEKAPSFVTEMTPAGIEVYYQWEPKRLYRLREPHDPDYHDEQDPEWVEVVSVTTALDVLEKGGLPWWGMKVGIEGTLAMHNMGLLRSVPYGQQRVMACVGQIAEGQSGLVVAGVDQIVELLTKHKLTVNHVRDTAGDRGQAVHDALEIWAKSGDIPDPEMFPPAEQGYVIGLCEFLKHVPSAVPVASEVMVGSLEHEFAGRYDIRFRTTEPHDVIVHRTPVRGPQWRRLEPGLFLGDLKTSSDVYPSHSRQLEAYERASIECGYEPTDARGVIHVNPDGTYEFKRSWATFEDFLCVLEVWRSEQAMKARKQQERKRK